jgi:hypothetical protein
VSELSAPPVALWRRADLVVLAGAIGGGLLLLGAGYWGVSGTRVFDDQVSAARLAAAGVLLAQAGFVWSVARGRRALGCRLRTALPARTEDVAVPPGPAMGTSPSAGPVAAADMTRYHRHDCAFVAGKAAGAAPVADHERAGRRPCGVCRP